MTHRCNKYVIKCLISVNIFIMNGLRFKNIDELIIGKVVLGSMNQYTLLTFT